MNEYELSPCPFCGGDAEFFPTDSTRITSADMHFDFKIRCKKCFCELHGIYNLEIKFGDCGQLVPTFDERKKAQEKWNRREY